MKEIALETDPTSLNQIKTELEVLHQSHTPYIIQLFGAFFSGACVYYCMEFMDASLDRMYQPSGVPEDVLAYIALCTVKGLKYLKDELHIMHRDIKPSNILVSRKGDVKLCDFGVSGKLMQSMAKTHVGCQSYMAPERITSSGSSYTAQSDIFSLGLTLFEIANGGYPYPRDKFDSLFSQLNAIVFEQMPDLSHDNFSQDCRDFISQWCVILFTKIYTISN